MSKKFRSLVAAVIAVSAFAGVASVHAEGRTSRSSLGVSFNVALNGTPDAQAKYTADVEKCNTGQTGQDKQTCLKEAGAALQQANAGVLTQGQTSSINALKANEVARCQQLPETDRRACIARANGAGTQQGSVSGGGIIRETVETIPPGATQGTIK